MQAQRINECLHAYGIHSTTLQPELVTPDTSPVVGVVQTKRLRERAVGKGRGGKGCRVNCGMACEELTCCG